MTEKDSESSAKAATLVPSGKLSDEGYARVLGFQIYWRSFGAKDTSSRKTVLCLHGGPGLTHDYLLALKDLTKFGYRVVFYDQLGCGKSELPKNRALFTIERAVEEVEAVRKELDLGKVHLLGSSYGGLLAIAYALQYQRNLRSLISVSGLDDVMKAVSEMERMKARLPASTLETLTKYEEEGDYDNPEYQNALMVFYNRHFCRLKVWPQELTYSLEHVSKPVYSTMNGPTEFAIIGNIRYWNVSRELNKITVPTLVTCGKYDEVSPKVARSIHTGIKHSKLVMFSNSSHMAMWEESEKFTRVLNDFLASVK
ncbi:MAG: proline iminopeptidase-family hydrolase [Nitrososphaerota archaeon]|nr:proline iminopeptidase-family hydrolase [Nitrososphaerota archaeon]